MEVYLGIDWSERKHDACFLNEAGAILSRLTVPHSAAGFAQLEKAREALGVSADACVVGLETAHTLLIDYLWGRAYSQVYVVPPAAVKSARPRLRNSGARTDQSDAYTIADLMRTDRARWYPWHPGSALLQQMRVQVSGRMQMLHYTLMMSNQLRALLLRYYPVALEVFSALAQPITLHFVLEYPTPAAAAALTQETFGAFAARHHYPHPQALVACLARLQRPAPQANPAVVAACTPQVCKLARLLLDFLATKHTLERELVQAFANHPDHAVFESLPGAGDFLAPALLVKFGEERERFPKPAVVQALAGTCPVTDQSGQHRYIHFRHACDHEFRFIAQEWARTSRRQSPWAAAYWDSVRPHCASDQHAYRCLANRWLGIAWKLWQNHESYDESYHQRQRVARAQPRA